MCHHGPNESAPEPAIGTRWDGSMANGPKAGLGGARGETGVAHQVGRFGKAFGGHRLGSDEQGPVGTDPGDGPEQSNSGDFQSHALDPFIKGLDHGPEMGDEGPLHADEHLLLGSQEGPCLRAHPLAAVSGEEAPTGHVEPHVVELGVNPSSSGRSHAYQPGPIAKQHSLFALLDRFGMHLGDEASQAHTSQEFCIKVVSLVVRISDDLESLGMSKDEANARAPESVEEPRPGRAGLDYDLHGTEPIQKAFEVFNLGVGDTLRSVYEISSVVHDGNDGICCVSIDSSDEHGWPP